GGLCRPMKQPFIIALLMALPTAGAILAAAQSGPAIESVAGRGKPGYGGDGGPAVKALLNQPFHCDLQGNAALFIDEAANHCVRKVDLQTGVITTVAGNGMKGYSGDGGKATAATMNEPYAVVVTDRGDLYIVDRLNAVVRRVDGATGTITTVAGT